MTNGYAMDIKILLVFIEKKKYILNRIKDT